MQPVEAIRNIWLIISGTVCSNRANPQVMSLLARTLVNRRKWHVNRIYDHRIETVNYADATRK